MTPRRRPSPGLTPRERQVLDSVRQGRTHKEVAFDLGLSSATVRVLFARALKKVGPAQGPPRDESG